MTGFRKTWLLIFLFTLSGWLGVPVSAQVAESQVEHREKAAPVSVREKLLAAKRIVFLGDSITNAGHYIVDLESRLLEMRSWKPGQLLINLGLSSETCCGLSEPAHPFPRPSVQTRIDDVLEKTGPDVVVVCYGVNDGIYHPYSKERFATFQAGLGQVVAKESELVEKRLALIRKRQSIMHPAWLTFVGHDRPGVKPGIAIELAAQRATEIGLQLEEMSLSETAGQ